MSITANGARKRAILVSERESDTIYSVYPEESLRRIGELCELDATLRTGEELLANPSAFADVAFVFSTWGMPTLTKEQVEACLPSLEAIFYAAGSVQYFARPYLAAGARVFSAWAANAIPVIEYSVAQIVLANKGYFASSRLYKAEGFSRANSVYHTYPGNYREKVGILGLGMIGRQVAERLAKGYALEVLGYDPYFPAERAEALGIRLAPLEEIFESCITVSNHIANIESTVGMLGYDLFRRMRPNATFINTGRGAQVVEDDLVRALTERPARSAVLDVTWPEPCAFSHPFHAMPNVTLTPHIAGAWGNELARMSEYMADECANYLAGRETRWEVTEKMLETMA